MKNADANGNVSGTDASSKRVILLLGCTGLLCLGVVSGIGILKLFAFPAVWILVSLDDRDVNEGIKLLARARMASFVKVVWLIGALIFICGAAIKVFNPSYFQSYRVLPVTASIGCGAFLESGFSVSYGQFGEVKVGLSAKDLGWYRCGLNVLAYQGDGKAFS